MSNDNKSTEHGASLPPLKYEAKSPREMADFVLSILHDNGSMPESKSSAYVEHLYRLATTYEKPAAAAERGAEWICAEDRMPPSGRTVLAVYTTHHHPPRQRINRAQWIKAKSVEAGSESEIGEYDEDTDTYYDPEGWYEQMDHWGEYGAVAMAGFTVTHWMPLPDTPENIDAPPPTQPAQADEDDLRTHRAAWRKALVLARDRAEVSPPDIDDRAYWAHEIAVFDRVSAAPPIPPAQAAEPAQVDALTDEELGEIARYVGLRTAMHGYNITDVRSLLRAFVNRLAALTQRPAAPLATDAGVPADSSVATWVIRAALAWASGNPNSSTACKNLLEATRAYRTAAHPAAERPAQGEAGVALDGHTFDLSKMPVGFTVTKTGPLEYTTTQPLNEAQLARRAPEGGRNDTEQA